MSENENPQEEQLELVPVTLDELDDFIANDVDGDVVLEGKPVDLVETLVDKGLIVPHIKPEDMVDKRFTVLSMKPRRGVTNPDGSTSLYFLCRVALIDEDGAEATTSLGGAVVVKHLAAYFKSGMRNPFSVRLVYHEGRGNFSGYYDLESIKTIK